MNDVILLAVGGGFAIGWFFIAVGVPCIALGIYMKKHPEVLEQKKVKGTGKKQPKKSSKGKKSKRQPKESKRQEKEKDSDPTGGGSLVWGGLGLVVLGIASIAYDLLK